MGAVDDAWRAGKEGFHAKPANWSWTWVAMWVVTTAVWFTANLVADSWWIRIGSVVVLFGLPEAFSLSKRDDAYPPLTHTIRHFLPNWLAFPGIYGGVGAVATRWLGQNLDLAWRVAVVMAILGWLTDHFTQTYQGEDPYPFSETDRRYDGPPRAA